MPASQIRRNNFDKISGIGWQNGVVASKITIELCGATIEAWTIINSSIKKGLAMKIYYVKNTYYNEGLMWKLLKANKIRECI